MDELSRLYWSWTDEKKKFVGSTFSIKWIVACIGWKKMTTTEKLPFSCGISCFPSKLCRILCECVFFVFVWLHRMFHSTIYCVHICSVNIVVNISFYIILIFHPITYRFGADNMEFISIIILCTRETSFTLVYRMLLTIDTFNEKTQFDLPKMKFEKTERKRTQFNKRIESKLVSELKWDKAKQNRVGCSKYWFSNWISHCNLLDFGNYLHMPINALLTHHQRFMEKCFWWIEIIALEQ